MKVDKSDLRHWLWLAGFGLNVVLAMALRPFLRRRRAGGVAVVLYGHKLTGNLLALHRAAADSDAVNTVFLTMDADYHRELLAQGEASCLATSAACVGLLARADAVVSDHGLHALGWVPGRSGLKFYDVWHGVPFKGFDADDFRLQHRYDEVWLTSPLLRDLYADRFGFARDRLQVTGYARTDALVRPIQDRAATLRRLGLQSRPESRFVLFAPTWKQDASERSLFPFGLDESDFIEQLAQACRSRDAVLLVRKHLNSGAGAAAGPDNVIYLPFAAYPDTESILQISDLLICDWSSIAFDYLVLDRPTIFLDVPPPFRKGFSLGPEYRFGAIVPGMAPMLDAVLRYLADPSTYREDVGDRPAAVAAQVYAGFADGRSAQRCLDRLVADRSR